MGNGCVPVGNTDMYYVSFGSGKKNLVVMPGLSDGLATVKGKSLFLAGPYKKFMNEYTIYMFSRKNKMPEGYSIRDMAEDQAAALKILGIEKTFVMGVSQGGMIAQYLAIDHRDLVEGLILAVTSPYANKTATEAVKGWISMVNTGDIRSLMVDTAEKMYSQAFLDKHLKYFSLFAKMYAPKSYERFLRNANAILEFDARDELSKISCPTLILAGSDDKTVGNEAPYELQKGIDGSELYIFEGFGHGAFEECKDFYDRVYDFCEKTNKTKRD